VTVYLIHLDQPLGDLANPRGQAQHYLGSTDDLPGRLAAHRRGCGAALMRAVGDAGISWRLARTWPGGLDLERQLKRRHRHADYCPICRSEAQL